MDHKFKHLQMHKVAISMRMIFLVTLIETKRAMLLYYKTKMVIMWISKVEELTNEVIWLNRVLVISLKTKTIKRCLIIETSMKEEKYQHHSVLRNTISIHFKWEETLTMTNKEDYKFNKIKTKNLLIKMAKKLTKMVG